MSKGLCVQGTRCLCMSLHGAGRQSFAAWKPRSRLQGAPKLKVAIVGSGLAGLSTAVELLDQVGAEGDGYWLYQKMVVTRATQASWSCGGAAGPGGCCGLLLCGRLLQGGGCAAVRLCRSAAGRTCIWVGSRQVGMGRMHRWCLHG